MSVAAREIERIRVGSYRAAKEVAGYEARGTPAEARFSLKYVVATALTHGSVRLAAFEPARLEDPATRALMERIDVAIDRELDAAFPRSARRASPSRCATAARGVAAAHAHRRSGCAALGRQLEDKYLELAAPVLGERARAQAARATVEARSNQEDLAA